MNAACLREWLPACLSRKSSSAGSAATAATACPGRARATPTASGSRRSCCSRRRSRAVIPYLRAFLARSSRPSRRSPRASEDEVLQLWSGLGYYARGRNLHAAAQEIAAQRLSAHRRRTSPSCRASAARPRRRSRCSRSASAPRSSTATSSACWRAASALRTRRSFGRSPKRCLPRKDVETYTQALMDLGATVCTRNPRLRRVSGRRRAASRARPGASPSCPRRARGRRCR